MAPLPKRETIPKKTFKRK